jgi:phage-related minor tail protein
LGAAWDDIADGITGRTGIMGNQLNGITDSIKQVGTQSALSFDEIANFAGGVAQSLHLAGVEATAMTQKLSDIQQVTGQAVSTKDLGKAFRLFDVSDVRTEIQTLQDLTAASQSTQIPINDLLTTLGNTGKASKEAGLDLQQTLGVLLTLEDAGVSFEKAGPALSIALKNWSKDGRDANVALAETITKIKISLTPVTTRPRRSWRRKHSARATSTFLMRSRAASSTSITSLMRCRSSPPQAI